MATVWRQVLWQDPTQIIHQHLGPYLYNLESLHEKKILLFWGKSKISLHGYICKCSIIGTTEADFWEMFSFSRKRGILMLRFQYSDYAELEYSCSGEGMGEGCVIVFVCDLDPV